MQTGASGVLVYIAKMNMNVFFKIEITGVGMLLQTTTCILFALQVLFYKVIVNTIQKFETGV